MLDDLHNIGATRKFGYQKAGNETMYNPMTGLPLEVPIFLGPTYY